MVRLSHDAGLTWSIESTAIAFWAAIALEPLSGPAAGNTSIRLSGVALPPCDGGACACRFGGVAVPASHSSSDADGGRGVRCQAPSLAALLAAAASYISVGSLAVVPVSYTPDGLVVSSEALTFTYFPSPATHNLSRTLLPLTGGHLLTVHGERFLGANGSVPDAAAEPYCRVGRAVVRATRLSASRLLCVAPSAAQAGIAPAEISELCRPRNRRPETATPETATHKPPLAQSREQTVAPHRRGTRSPVWCMKRGTRMRVLAPLRTCGCPPKTRCRDLLS